MRKTGTFLALALSLLCAAPADAGWTGLGGWRGMGWSKASAAGGVAALTLPVQIGVSEPASATQFAYTPSVSVPAGQAIVVFVFSGAAQANASGCSTAICTSRGDNLTCDAGTSGGTGQVFKCQGVLTLDLRGTDTGGSDTIKVGLAGSSGPIIYAVGVPSGGITAASTATAIANGNIFDTGSVALTPTKWVIGFEEDNGGGQTTTPSGGFTGLGASPLLGSLYQITAYYKQATSSPFDLGITHGAAAAPTGYLSYQVFN